MNFKAPYDIERLIKYVKGDLSELEATFIKQQIQNDKILERIVEGIKTELNTSADTNSFENYLANAKESFRKALNTKIKNDQKVLETVKKPAFYQKNQLNLKTFKNYTKYIRDHHIITKPAAAFILNFLLLAGIIYCFKSLAYFKPESENSMSMGVVELPKESTSAEYYMQFEDKNYAPNNFDTFGEVPLIEEDSFTAYENVKSEEHVSINKQDFYIQIGAYFSLTRAEREIEGLRHSLEEKVSIDVITSNDNTLYRVQIGPFATRDSAINFLKIEKIEGFLVIKP